MSAPRVLHERSAADGQPRICARCHRPAHDWRSDHFRRYMARGLCNICYVGRHTRGLLDEFDRTTMTRDEVMTEWVWLRSEGYTKRQAAERLGMTYDAFCRAFQRAHNAGDPRALPAIPRVAVSA